MMGGNMQFDHLYRLDENRTKRESSWDRRGMNADYIVVAPGEERVLASLKGPAKVNHLYCIVIDPTMLVYRKMVLCMYWDGESEPSVEVPLGDFFCVSHCMPRSVNSLLVTVNPGNKGSFCPPSYGLNAYFPMPFAEHALITLRYDQPAERKTFPLMFWYHIDYEEIKQGPVPDARFHAGWNREHTTKTDAEIRNVHLWDGVNVTGAGNYKILEAKGKGQLVGLHLEIDNVTGGWYGEGDDMIFIDGDRWPPSIHGTGTEEVFGGGACPSIEYSGPYSGFHLIEHENFAGKNGMYRWYIADPVKFSNSLLVTIEHGHANNFENDYASVAYWYQTEPHYRRSLPAVEKRLPRIPDIVFDIEERIADIIAFQPVLKKEYGESGAFGMVWKIINEGVQAIHEKRYEDALGLYTLNLDHLKRYVR